MIKKKRSMTCIAAIRQKNGKILVAADRRVSWGLDQMQKMPHPKVSKKGGMIFAGTGSLSLMNLVVNVLVPREYDFSISEDIYLHTIFYNDIIKLLKSHGFIDTVGSYQILKIPREIDAEILIVLNRKLYHMIIENPDIESDIPNGMISIEEISLPYATGCGGAFAWGSLLTTEDTDMKPRDRLTLALQVAAKVSPGCDDNIDIVGE